MFQGQVFKDIDPNNIRKESFYVYKSFSYSEADYKNDYIQVSFATTASNGWTLDDVNNETNYDGTYKVGVYAYINSMYYTPLSNSKPIEYFGDYFERMTSSLEDKAIFIGIPSDLYGEKIKQWSVDISINSIDIYDDGYGNLKYMDGATETNCGNVFYRTGDIVITEPSIVGTDDTVTGSFELSFKSTVKIITHEYNCMIGKGEFGMTYNPSAYTSSNGWPIDTILSSSNWSPYITSIALYDDEYNMIAVGKLGQVVKNDANYDLNIVMRFDL